LKCKPQASQSLYRLGQNVVQFVIFVGYLSWESINLVGVFVKYNIIRGEPFDNVNQERYKNEREQCVAWIQNASFD
jgi:hypothetical protein